MNLTQEQAVFMQHVAELIKKAPDYGLVLTGGELYRTPEQQQIYLKTGRSKTLNSQHLKRLAIDLNFFRRNPDHSLTLVADGPEVRQLGAFWESLAPGLKQFQRRAAFRALAARAGRAHCGRYSGAARASGCCRTATQRACVPAKPFARTWCGARRGFAGRYRRPQMPKRARRC
jgi:hypothetical protein